MNDVLNQLDASRAEFQAAIDRRDLLDVVYEETEDSDAWLLKDLLTHIAAWEQTAITALQTILQGEEYIPIINEKMSIQDFNDLNFARRQHFSPEKAAQEWQETRDWVRQLVQELPDDKRTLRYPWGGQGTPLRMVLGLVHHEQEHLHDLTGQSE
jgi:hypothetical protein